MGMTGGSEGKASACNAGDPSSVLFLVLSRAPELSVNKLSGLQGPVRMQPPRNCGEAQEFFDCQHSRLEGRHNYTRDERLP